MDVVRGQDDLGLLTGGGVVEGMPGHGFDAQAVAGLERVTQMTRSWQRRRPRSPRRCRSRPGSAWCSTLEQDPSLGVGGARTHHPSVPAGLGPFVLSVAQPAGGTEAAGAPEADGDGAGAAGDTTRRSARTIAPGSARLWFVRTAIVSAVDREVADRAAEAEKPARMAEARMPVDREGLDPEPVRRRRGCSRASS